MFGDDFQKRVTAFNRKMCAASVRAALKPDGNIPSPAFRVTFHKDNPDTPACLAKLYKLGVSGDSVSFI